MSSVPPPDRAQQDEVRRVRDSYSSKESEETKKHNQELRKITETHQAEIEKLKEEHHQQMEELKANTREILTKRDMKYQHDIEELRDLHQKQIERTAMESEDRVAGQVEAVKGDFQHQKATSEMQKNQMRQAYEAQLRDKDKSLDDFASRTRETIHDTIDGQNKRQAKAREAEVGTIVKDRDRRIGDLQNSYTSLRKNKDQQLKLQQREAEDSTSRLQQNFQASLGTERENNQVLQNVQREGFEQSLDRNKDRYEKALDENREAMESAREGLTDSVQGRVNNKLKSLELESNKLKNEGVRDKLSTEAHHKREMQDLKDEFSTNLNLYEKNRKEALEAVNESSHHDIDQANAKNTAVLQENNRFYLDKEAMDQSRENERVTIIKTEGDKEKDHNAISTKNRFERLKAQGDRNETQQRGYFDRATAQMKENFENQLREMRAKNRQDQNQLMSTFSKQMQETDGKFQDKIGDVQNKYETEITALNEKHQKEMKDILQYDDRRLKETEKKASIDNESQTSQFGYRISKLEEQHKREMKDMQHRHEETLANLLKNKQT